MRKFSTALILFCCCLTRNTISAQSNEYVSIINKWAGFGNAAKWDSTFYYARKAQQIAEIDFGKMSSKNAQTLAMVLGVTYLNYRDYLSSYRYTKQGIDIFEAINDTSNEQFINALNNLGSICETIGLYSDGEFYLSKCVEISKKHKKPDFIYESSIGRAIIYDDIGEYYKAEVIYRDLMNLADTMQDLHLKAYRQMCIYSNLAKIYTETGDIKKGATYCAKAVAICKTPAFNKEYKSYDYLTVLLNLAEAYINIHKTDSASLLCREAQRFLGNSHDSILQSYIIEEQGNINIAKKELTKAIPQLKRALQLRTVLLQTLAVADNDATIIKLADLYRDVYQFKLADSIYKKEINKCLAAGVGGANIFQQTTLGLCKSLMYQQKYAEAFDSLLALGKIALTAIDKNFAGMTETEQLNFIAGFDAFFDMANTLLSHAARNSQNGLKDIYTLQLQRKSLVLANQAGLLNNMRNTGDTAAANVFTTWLANRQMLAKQYSLPYADRFLDTDSLADIADRLEKQLSAKGLATGFTTNQNVFALLQQRSVNSAAIEFVRFNYITKNVDADSAAYAAFVFKGGDSLPIFVPLCSEKALLKLMVDGYGKPMPEAQLTQNLYKPGTKSAAALYKLVWQPLEKYLIKATEIKYSPAGLLNNVSFHALNNSRGYLAERYTIRRFINLADAKSADATELPQAISLWGNMVYNALTNPLGPKLKDSAYLNNIASLAASGIKPSIQSKSLSKEPLQSFLADEITPIQQLFLKHGIPYSSNGMQNATEESFKAQATAIKGVLHISTHGFYTPLDKIGANSVLPGSFIASNTNPLFRCGLAFAGVNYYWMKGVPQPNREDGILTGYEAAQLDLHNVQLVTISACETGLGDVTANEGNLGMQRAFKLAGAKNLLVSLWQVPAKATQQLLTKFYGYWLQGNNLSKALQLAETDTQKIHPAPFYWAGFVLVE